MAIYFNERTKKWDANFSYRDFDNKSASIWGRFKCLYYFCYFCLDVDLIIFLEIQSQEYEKVD